MDNLGELRLRRGHRNSRAMALVTSLRRLAVLALSVCAFASACDEGPTLPRLDIGVLTSSGTMQAVFRVDIAATVSARAQGLAGRKGMPMSEGFLQLYRQPGEYVVSLKHAAFETDIVFISGQGEILEVKERVPAYSTALVTISQPSQFILQLAGGAAEVYGVEKGQNVVFQGALPVPDF